MRLPRKTLPIALAALSLAAAGCGDGDKKIPQKQIEQIVVRFAEADDASACDLLSERALTSVYGGFKKPVGESRKICREASRKFKGAPVKITAFKVLDDDTVKVGALRADGQFTYSVALRRFGKRWLIDDITQERVR